MIEAVFTFAFITAIGEFILLHSMPGLRTFFFASPGRETFLHVLFMCLNLWIHWGTMTGTMTGITAFLVSWCVCLVMKPMYRRA